MFRPRPYDPDRKDKRTDAQKAASRRNFGIFQLRGLWALAGMLREPYRSTVRVLIDADLIARGAAGESERQAEHRNKLWRGISDVDTPF